jgi:hypothetical protein
MFIHFLQDQELDEYRHTVLVPARMQAELDLLRTDNSNLRRFLLAMQNEVYGARLAAKYLDKELAGR